MSISFVSPVRPGAMLDTIIEAARLHPVALADALVAIADTHGAYARQTYSRQARDSALRMGADAASLSRQVAAGRMTYATELTFAQTIIGFEPAARMLGFSRQDQMEIVKFECAQNAARSVD